MKAGDLLDFILSFPVRILLLSVGVFCILSPDAFSEFLPLIVGTAMVFAGLFGIGASWRQKNFRNPGLSTMGESIVLTLLGVVLLLAQGTSLLMLGVIWGLLGLGKGAKEINTFLYRLVNKENWLFPLIMGLLEIGFGLILIMEPTEHITFHIMILGINMVLYSIRDPAPHKKNAFEIAHDVL